MKRLFFWLIKPWVRSLIGLSILSLLIWFEGPLLVFNGAAPLASEQWRWVCIALLFLGWMGCFCWSTVTITFSGVKPMQQPMQQLAADAPVEPKPEAQAFDAEMSILGKRMKEVKDALKKIRRVGGGSAQLPWYLVLGASGAGKTTALVHADLKFPVFGAVDRADGVRQCEWRLTEDAVLLDTPGRYTTHDSAREAKGEGDRRAWQGFLQIIRKERRRRPINGVIVVLDVTDLLQKSDSALHVQALAIRERIKELHEQFGIRFPIYVVLSKCDLLAGFSEFFDNLGRAERGQVWGFTFPPAEANPSAIATERGLSLFAAEFRHLEQQMQCRLLDRLQQEHDVQRRALIYDFPQQFAALGDGLEDFLTRAFEASRFEVAAMLRGVYFTSAAQQAAAESVVDGGSNFRSYFISRLLRDVIFQEAGLAGSNLRLERNRRHLQWGASTVLALVLVLGGAGLSGSYLRNQGYVTEVAQRTAELETRAQAISAQDGLAITLPVLNAARDLPGGYADRTHAVPVLMRLGLYQGRNLGVGAQRLYQRLLKEVLLPQLVNRIEAELRRGNADTPDYLFETLRVYLMLGDRTRFDAESMLAWLADDWGRHPPAVNGMQRSALSNHFAVLLFDVDQLPAIAQLDAGLIARTRLILAGMPLEQRIYGRVRQELARANVPAFDIGAAGGRAAYQVLTRRSGLPLSQGAEGIYNRAGYQKFMAQADQAIAAMLQDDWVSGHPEVVPDLDRQRQIKTALQQLYFDDYIQQWDDMLADVAVIPFTSLDQAARVTGILSAPDSPLRKFLQEAARQTTLDDIKPSKIILASVSTALKGKFNVAKKKLESLIGTNAGEAAPPQAKSMNPVDAHFNALHKMVGAPGAAAPSPLDQVLLKLKDAAAFFDAANSAKAAGVPAPASDALASLKRDAIGTPAPLAAMLQNIDSSGAGLALGSERERLNALWVASIAPFCRRAVAKRYPLSRSATQEVTPDDFGNFFGPGGMMDDFFQKNLRPYVDLSGMQWRWRAVNKVSLGIPQTALNEFQRAAMIRDKFFNGGERQVTMRFELKPLSVDTHFSKVLLEMDGQTLNYEQNTAFRPASFQIPSAIGGNLARLEVTPAGSTPELRTEGPWAWLRMMDLGVLEPGAQGERFKLRYDLDGKPLVFELTASSVNNPFRREALEQFHCLERL